MAAAFYMTSCKKELLRGNAVQQHDTTIVSVDSALYQRIIYSGLIVSIDSDWTAYNKQSYNGSINVVINYKDSTIEGFIDSRHSFAYRLNDSNIYKSNTRGTQYVIFKNDSLFYYYHYDDGRTHPPGVMNELNFNGKK